MECISSDYCYNDGLHCAQRFTLRLRLFQALAQREAVRQTF